MGWKTINGRQYYYRSRREGGRVTTEYCGCGYPAGLFAQLDEIDRRDRLLQQLDAKAERDEWRQIDEALDDLVAAARRAASEALTAAGYHRHHRGEWRKRRGS